MSLPGNIASTTPVVSALLPPDAALRTDRLVDFELGGVALNDASLGVQVRQWRVFVDSGNVCVAPYPEGAPMAVLFDATNVTELSLAFDQLMHPTVAFVQAGVAKLYWFDSLASAQVTTSYADASSPMLCMDDKRASQVAAGVTDVLFFYLLGGNLCYRQQRDRFSIERVLSALPAGASQITGVGMGINGRVQIFLNAAPLIHVTVQDDEIYVLGGGTSIQPLHGGAASPATWRSKVYERHDQPSFAWARVDAVAYPVTLKVLAGGLPVATLTLASEEAVRLPDVRSREWSVEVTGTARVLSVRLASSLEELEADDGRDL